MITQFFAKASSPANAKRPDNGSGSGGDNNNNNNNNPAARLRSHATRSTAGSPTDRDKPSIPRLLSPPPPSSSSRPQQPLPAAELPATHKPPPPPPPPPTPTPLSQPLSSRKQDSSSSSSSSSTSRAHTFPYPFAIRPLPSPHPAVTIDPIHDSHVHALSLITGVLLPVRYSRSFYDAFLKDPTIRCLSRVAVYRGHDGGKQQQRHKQQQQDAKRRKLSQSADADAETDANANAGANADADAHADADANTPGEGKVIGFIRCSAEPNDDDNNKNNNDNNDNVGGRPANQLYLETLGLLGPWRRRGIATAMLDSILYEPPGRRRFSPLVRHYNIRSVKAHIHSINDDALAWYLARGFAVQPGLVDGYYRRLTPTTARVVVLDLQRVREGGGERDEPAGGSSNSNGDDDQGRQDRGEGGDGGHDGNEDYEDDDDDDDDDAISLIEAPSEAGEKKKRDGDSDDDDDDDWEKVEPDDARSHDGVNSPAP